jgi:membrane protein DedA with SNARE-associated domain/membrane-associated phospholipid phosphatase
METWLQTVADWLPTGWLYFALIGTVSFLESVALLGIFVPGSVLIVFVGFLAAHGKGDILLVIAVSAAGSILGDLISYWAGARFGVSLLQTRTFLKRKDLLEKARSFFISHGGKSVFFGRFIGFLRPFIPFVAGSARMSPWRFLVYALVSGVLWGLAYPGLGYFFGASWQMVKIWTGRFSFLVTIILALFILNGIFWRWAVPPLVRGFAFLWGKVRTAWQSLLEREMVRSFAGRHPRLWSFVAARFTLEKGSGLYLTTGFFVSVLFALLFGLVARELRLGSPMIATDQRIYDLLQEYHHPAADLFFIIATYLGSAPAILMIGGLTLLCLFLVNRDFSALILLGGTAAGEVLVFILKDLFRRPRPVPVFPELLPLSASFPSGHAFVAMVFYGFLTYLLLGTVRNWNSRFLLVLAGSFLVILIGFSRIYLGVHWLSDVLGGLALAALWLNFLITACEMRFRYGGEFPWRQGLEPINLRPAIRLAIIIPAFLATLLGLYLYIDRHVPAELWKELKQSVPGKLHPTGLEKTTGEYPAARISDGEGVAMERLFL